MTAKPMPSASLSMTLGAASSVSLGPVPSAPWWLPQPAPCVTSALPFHGVCGAHGAHGFLGSNSTAIWYWSRSAKPVSTRTMNGTVCPSCVVVVATSLGGLLGS